MCGSLFQYQNGVKAKYSVTRSMNMKKNKSIHAEKEGPQLIITTIGSPSGCSLEVKKEKSREKKRRTSADAQALAL